MHAAMLILSHMKIWWRIIPSTLVGVLKKSLKTYSKEQSLRKRFPLEQNQIHPLLLIAVSSLCLLHLFSLLASSELVPIAQFSYSDANRHDSEHCSEQKAHIP